MATQHPNNTEHAHYLDYHYRELVRLSEIQNSHLNHAFANFKLFGAVGAMLAWKPLTAVFIEQARPLMLLIGFVALLFVALLILFYDFMRQSIMLFYTEQVKHHEAVLRQALQLGDERSFAVASQWKPWAKKVHEPIAVRFFAYLYLLMIAFPTAVFFASGENYHALAYLAIAVVLIGVHACMTAVIIRQVDLTTG